MPDPRALALAIVITGTSFLSSAVFEDPARAIAARTKEEPTP